MLACTRGLDSEEWRGIIWWVTTTTKKSGRGRSERGDLEQAVIRSLLKKPTFACNCLAVGRFSSVTSSFRVRFFKEDSVDIALKKICTNARNIASSTAPFASLRVIVYSFSTRPRVCSSFCYPGKKETWNQTRGVFLTEIVLVLKEKHRIKNPVGQGARNLWPLLGGNCCFPSFCSLINPSVSPDQSRFASSDHRQTNQKSLCALPI